MRKKLHCLLSEMTWRSKLLFMAVFTLLSFATSAQVSLGTSPYTQNFNSGTLPTGWTTRTGASASSLGTTATPASPDSWSNTTGNFRFVASAKAPLTSASSSTAQNSSADRALAVRPSGSFGDPGNAFVLQLANTTGKNNFSLSFAAQLLDPQTRVLTYVVDYGFGSSPTSFTSTGTAFVSNTVTGNVWGSATVNVSFGSALDNQSQNVWIRIVQLAASSGSGSRPTVGIDDVSLSFGTVLPTPTTTSISPSSATAGGAGFTITVNGTNFVSGSSTVTWNGSNRTTTFVSATQLTATIPSTDITTTGTAQVGVTTTGAAAASNTQAFTINAPAVPSLSITGTTAHGTVCPTSSGTPIQYTITNSGSATANGVSVVSSNPSEFTVSGLSSTTIAGSGGTATYFVTFTPSSAGAKSATVTVSSTTPGSNSPTSSLTGTGTTAVSSAVTTNAASAIDNTNATLNGNVTTLGICPNTIEKGFVYSLTSANANPVNGGSGVTTAPVAGLTTGAYNLPLSGLTNSSSYSFKAYVYNGTTYTYGALQTFSTLAPADHLVFIGVPATGFVATDLAAFTVEARRPDNSVDASYTGTVTISKASGPGALSGTLSVAAVAGSATFDTAQFSAVGTYTLSAADGSLAPATSGSIVISVAPVKIASWNFNGLNTVDTAQATTFVTGLDASGGKDDITRGAGASASAGANSFRTTGFQDDGISTSNTDYFQTTLSASAGYSLSLASIENYFNGTSSFYAGAGVSSQYAYSLDGTNFTLIGSPVATFGNSALPAVDLSGIAALQNVAPGTVVTIRYYASGQTSTGGWGYYSPNTSTDGLSFLGAVNCLQPTAFTVTGGGVGCASNGVTVGLTGSQTGITYQLKVDGADTGAAVAGTGSAIDFGAQTVEGIYTVEAANLAGGCSNTATMNGSTTVTLSATPVGGTVSGSASVCSGTNSGSITLSGYTGDITTWQSSSVSDFSSDVTDIAVTIATLNYTNLNATTYYRAEVGSGSCPVAYSDVATITVTENQWTGAVDSDWNTPGNWSCGMVPGFASDITITSTANQPVISNDITLNSLALAANSSVEIETGYDLTLTDSLNVDGTASFTLNNDANLLQVNNSPNVGVISVNRNSSALMRLDYTAWSSPVDGQNLLAFSPATTTTRFYTYNTNTNLYNTIASPAATTFETAKGYLIRMPNNHPTTPTVWNGVFMGTPHNGDYTYTLEDFGDGQRFNLVGNPYPSPMDATTFVTDNSASITGTLYFWRKTNNAASPSYSTWTTGGFISNGEAQNVDPQGIIQTGQGFIVEGTGADSSLEFNNLQRSDDNAGQFFRSAQLVEHNRFWLNFTNADGVFSQILVNYMTGATQDVDFAIDGKYMNDSPYEFYSLIGAGKYAIQGRALPFASADVVPLGFKADVAGSYTISIDHVDGLFGAGQSIFLRDNLTGTVFDFADGAYTFATESGVFNSRFDVIYENALSAGHPDFSAATVVAYKQNDRLVVNSGSATMSSVKIFDVAGRLLVDRENINSSEVSLSPTTANQMLLIQVKTTENQTVIKKIAY